ncbi:hypothetical protein ASPWEDRAFT_44707 [Aspergillus wentii DTO 134E9]|uniref:Uncharacterized protein n=1 Tax=Aspergillus wentii DTO 134E9 TaxID=1073089 RepID=A0A1L9RCA2_ASPWE|nr:uncharacterized protein ASPWEDRAFT_44707 [Aspergillus wentii DTO 134E9]KAI9935114.1 hypothetical protein MW887_000735 [Aspergillus wentii]OJJ32555.1 hypothetical protein ASPWEDRAFT_44707 [Aspergillus wentii DTO 134E9]
MSALATGSTSPPDSGMKTTKAKTKEAAEMDRHNFLRDLPPRTPQVVATNVRTIKSAVTKHLKDDAKLQYLVVHYVPTQVVQTLVENPRSRGSTASRIFYDENLRVLVIKFLIKIYEVASRELRYRINGWGSSARPQE